MSCGPLLGRLVARVKGAWYGLVPRATTLCYEGMVTRGAALWYGVVVMVWLVFVSGVAGGAELVLRQRFIPTGPVIHLGDIADIHAADGVEARRLATLPLWAAPVEGEQRLATLSAVRDALRLQGIDPAGLQFSGATRVAIGTGTTSVEAPAMPQPPTPRPGGTTIGTGFRPPRAEPTELGPANSPSLSLSAREELVNHFREEVLIYLEQMSGDVGNLDVELRLTPQQVEALARNSGGVVISGGRSPWTGRQLLTAEIVTGSGSQSLTFAADVLNTTPVLVAKRPLMRGQTITAADVELQSPTREMRISPSRAVISSLEGAVGLEAARAIRPGEVVTTELCLAPLMVQRNQLVSVAIAGGGLELSRQAKALTEARLGEFTEVQLLNSKERLAARVVGPGKLAMADTSTPAAPVTSPPRPRRYQP